MTEEIRDKQYDYHMYGDSPLKEIIEQLLLIKAQEKYMKNYYKIPEDED